jgi:hypothetical protein
MLFGCKLEEVTPTGEKHVQALKGLKAAPDEMAEVVKSNGEGALFFGGAEPIYADLFIAALLAPTESIVGKESDILKTIMSASEGHWVKFLEYFNMYEKVD